MAKTKQQKKKSSSISPNGQTGEGRSKVLKTYKLFMGGKFPRSESGRYFVVKGAEGKPMANMCRASRKDVKDAVKAARAGFADWSGRTAYNRGQILYRMAEMLEGRNAQFIDELQQHGATKAKAEQEVALSIDRLVHYAGWSDKFQQIQSTVNPVSTPHFNFSLPEPTGVVMVVAPQEQPLLGLISLIAPVIVSGNACVVLASSDKPIPAMTFAEVLHSSDTPGGVVNVLTGYREELIDHIAGHMDINAVVVNDLDPKVVKELQVKAASNVKRVFVDQTKDWSTEKTQGPRFIERTTELKTTWHPVENFGGIGG